MYKYIIIGNGAAGLFATQEIRKNDKDGSILIISEEKYPTYFRTKLSELIPKEFEVEDILVKKESRYEENKIDQRLATSVTRLDREEKKVETDGGEVFEYEKLLIATGSNPFIPPIDNIDSEGVFAIRKACDLKDFQAYLKKVKRVLIIGGGLLGLEAAYSIHQAGKEVLVIESFDRLLGKQLDPKSSEVFEEKLADLGIKAQTGKNTKKILAEDGRVTGIELEDGTVLEGEAILVQTGVRSEISLAKEAGLEVERGIVVGENLVTTRDESIYVAGDCAQVGKATMGLWTASMEMGKIAGSNMTGGDEKYETPKPFSTIALGDIKVFSAGFSSGEGVTEEKRVDGDKVYKLFYRDGKICGGILWQDTSYQNDVKKLVFEGESLENTKLGKLFE